MATPPGDAPLRSAAVIVRDEALGVSLQLMLQACGVAAIVHPPESGLGAGAMNSFVIAVGSYVRALTDLAIATAEKIGPVSCDMGPNGCKVPTAVNYIRKIQQRGTIGKKRKSAKC